MAPSFSNLKKNKNGGTYVNGKSLPLPLRKEIVERYLNGERVVSIGRSMKLTHGVVSKITRHFKKTGSFLPRNIRSPPPTKMPFTVDAMLDNTIKPTDPSTLNLIPENAAIAPVMASSSMPSVPIIPPLQAIQMAQLLEQLSSLSANQWNPVNSMIGNTANSADISKSVITNPSKPPTSYPIPTNVAMPPTVPNQPTSAVQIIPTPEIAQFAHLQQLQWLVWMNSADRFRL